VSAFSDDGQWWWDGQRWIATSEVVLPQLPMTEFEQSGKLNQARNRMRKRDWFLAANEAAGVVVPDSRFAPLLGLPLALPFLVLQQRAFRDHRLWTLEQLALATAYLLGPDEAMVAGETTIVGSTFLATVKRDLAVVVTGAHVLILRIDCRDGQPRWVALAARPSVKIELRSGPFGYNPILFVIHGSWEWAIRGYQRVFQPYPVLQAWRQAAS
jgi:hypothetical protein